MAAEKFEIKINENFAIRRDAYNFILCKFSIGNDPNQSNYGKTTIKDSWFYGSLESALRGFIGHSDNVEPLEVRSVQDYIKQIKNAKEQVLMALKDGVAEYEQTRTAVK